MAFNHQNERDDTFILWIENPIIALLLDIPKGDSKFGASYVIGRRVSRLSKIKSNPIQSIGPESITHSKNSMLGKDLPRSKTKYSYQRKRESFQKWQTIPERLVGMIQVIQMKKNLVFKNIPPPEPRPAHALIVSLEEGFVQSNRAFWEKCLIGLLIDSRKFEVSRTQSIIGHYWYLRGPVKVVGRVRRYYVIHFDVDEDRHQMLHEGPWAMQGGLLSMFPWEPNLVVTSLLVIEVARQWIQDQYGNDYGTMINQAYFAPKARRFQFQPRRRTTYIRALYTRNGYQYRPCQADPVDFYFDPWVPMEANGNMDPPTTVELEDIEEQAHTEPLSDNVLDTQLDFEPSGIDHPCNPTAANTVYFTRCSPMRAAHNVPKLSDSPNLPLWSPPKLVLDR
ncbi:reverse transcriptase [Senna tora]|uniref:Reverse transcriptase n=1 Tax=Senna tora TaxID=362788 RepID=A0A834WAN6_9FABA|nr:reverse transcriptase [Senna tora]